MSSALIVGSLWDKSEPAIDLHINARVGGSHPSPREGFFDRSNTVRRSGSVDILSSFGKCRLSCDLIGETQPIVQSSQQHMSVSSGKRIVLRPTFRFLKSSPFASLGLKSPAVRKPCLRNQRTCPLSIALQRVMEAPYRS